MASPKRFETGLKMSETVGKQLIWKLMASPKRWETGLKPSETVGEQLEISGQSKEV